MKQEIEYNTIFLTVEKTGRERYCIKPQPKNEQCLKKFEIPLVKHSFLSARPVQKYGYFLAEIATIKHIRCSIVVFPHH